jgi:2',3'-cyclic-nucleotide 2'-phosphodiesterase (5'-nucleotidase family)
MLQNELGQKMEPFVEEVGYTEKLLKSSYDEETELGNMLAAAVKDTVAAADFALISPSLLR